MKVDHLCFFFEGGGGDTFPGADPGISLTFLVSWMHLECLDPPPSSLLLPDIGLELVPAVIQSHSLTFFSDCNKIACVESIS